MKKIFRFLKNKKGTTLVEVMIALGMFSIFITVAIGGFIQALSNQRVVLKLMAATDNMSMSLEQITREVRVGKLFSQIPNGFQFERYPTGDTPMVYRYELDNGKIKRTVSNEDGSNQAVDYITADNVVVSYFNVIIDSSGQPKVTLTIGVTAQDKALEITNYIQSTISSRLITAS